VLVEGNWGRGEKGRRFWRRHTSFYRSEGEGKGEHASSLTQYTAVKKQSVKEAGGLGGGETKKKRKISPSSLSPLQSGREWERKEISTTTT